MFPSKSRLRTAPSMLGAAMLLLTGCGSPPRATPPSPVSSAAPDTPAPPSFVAQADQAFKSHAWDEAISLYSMALDAPIPHGPVTTHGSDAYVRRNISRAHEYQGVEASQTQAYTYAVNEFRAALKADRTNVEAKRLLVRTQREGSQSERQNKREQDAQNAREAEYQASQTPPPLTTIPLQETPDPDKSLNNDVKRQNGQ